LIGVEVAWFATKYGGNIASAPTSTIGVV